LHDIIFFYTKSDKYTFNELFRSTTEGQLKKHLKGWDRNSVIIEGERQPQLIIYDKEKVEYAIKNKTLDLSAFARIIENDRLETKESDVWTDINITSVPS
jgi:hypothetical protein